MRDYGKIGKRKDQRHYQHEGKGMSHWRLWLDVILRSASAAVLPDPDTWCPSGAVPVMVTPLAEIVTVSSLLLPTLTGL